MRAVLSLFGLSWLLLLGGCPVDVAQGFHLMNRRDHPLELTARLASDCGSHVDLGAASTFGDEQTLTMDPQSLESLRALIGWQPPSPDGGASCTALWLKVEDGPDAVLTWQFEPFHQADESPERYAIIFEGPRDRVQMRLPGSMQRLPAPTH